MDNLVVLNNEKISEKNNKFYCRNFNFKILPEGLNKFFNVQPIKRPTNSPIIISKLNIFTIFFAYEKCRELSLIYHILIQFI